MPADEDLIAALAGAVLDGERVDWETASSRADARQRALVRQLEVLAAVAGVHREEPAPPDRPPDLSTWGPLLVLEKLGEGSFSEVFRARDTRLEREVALKLLRRAESESAEVDSVVIDEGRMLARVRHPNVVTVYGADRVDGRVGLWMELVRGRTLERALREQGPFGVQEASILGIDLCRALSAVHRAGLLHRDVKAQNVMREEGGRIVLMDFGTGLARSEGEDPGGGTAGTPLYLAPEVLAGGPASVRSDVYGLGALLFHLVTGTFPVDAASVRELREKHERGERTLLRDARPELPERFVTTVERALAAASEDRFESAGAMELALLAVLGAAAGEVSAVADDRPFRSPRSSRRLLVGGLAALGVAAVAAVAALLAARQVASAANRPFVHGVRRLTEFPGIEEFPALSPDGKSVAFTAREDGHRQVFVRLLAGGPPFQVTRDLADHQQPRWTPDSSGLVYFSRPESGSEQGSLREISALGGPSRPIAACVGGGDVNPIDGRVACVRLADERLQMVTAERDGSAPRVLAELEGGHYYLYPRWSPDGRWIAYQRGDGVRFDVFALPTGGGDARRLTADETRLDGFTWLPDGSGIVFSSSRGSSLPYLPEFRLWEARLTDPEPRALTSGESSFVHPDFNRTGELVAGRMRMQSDLWKFPVDGSPTENVGAGVRLTRQTGYVQTPSVGPGDREVVYLSDSGGRADLWILDTVTRESHQVTHETEPGVAVGVPLWSPDGASIAFVTSRGNAGLWFGLWLVDPDGSDLRKLVQHGLGAAWSADGRSLYCVDGQDDLLKKIPATGGAPIVVRRERVRNVIGSHGPTLYYVVERALVDGRPEFEIRAATPESGPSRLLAPIPASRVASWQIVNPALSPDGEWLLQPLTDGVTTDLWALSTATGAWRRLTDFGDRATFIARRAAWSGDGKWVFAAVGDGDADIVQLEVGGPKKTR